MPCGHVSAPLSLLKPPPGSRLCLQLLLHSSQGLQYLGRFSEHSDKQEVIVGKTLCNNEHSTIKPNIRVRGHFFLIYWILEKETEKLKWWGHKWKGQASTLGLCSHYGSLILPAVTGKWVWFRSKGRLSTVGFQAHYPLTAGTIVAH